MGIMIEEALTLCAMGGILRRRISDFVRQKARLEEDEEMRGLLRQRISGFHSTKHDLDWMRTLAEYPTHGDATRQCHG